MPQWLYNTKMIFRQLPKFNKIAIGALIFTIVFGVSFVVLYLLNFVPDELVSQNITVVPSDTASTTTIGQKQFDLPVKIVIEKIGVNSIIQNPSTTNILALDDLLTHGAVRYPGSGLPTEGNMFLFGHSTSFKVVNNQAYKTFNNLKLLSAGDMITIFSETKKYTYSVTKVSLVNSQDTVIDLNVKKPILTLSSCNTLGAKEQRYVVEADYVGNTSI